MTPRSYVMSNPRSSFPGKSHPPDRGGRAWPWLLAAGPAFVIVASLVTAWLALTRTDNVVADDYYKLGLTINRRIAATAPMPAVGATVDIASTGEIRVHLSQTTPLPIRLRMTVSRPAEHIPSYALALERRQERDYVGALPDIGTGRHVIALEADGWKLPVTIVDRLPASLVLGAADAPS